MLFKNVAQLFMRHFVEFIIFVPANLLNELWILKKSLYNFKNVFVVNLEREINMQKKRVTKINNLLFNPTNLLALSK